MIKLIKLNNWFFSRFHKRQFEIVVPQFEEVQKNKLGFLYVVSSEASKDTTVQCFEEVQKKPAGFF